jgi:integrase/recombinase XerD
MIEKYFEDAIINGMKEYTVTYQKSILEQANNFKPLKTWNKDDVNQYLIWSAKEHEIVIDGKKKIFKANRKSTIEIKKTILKTFFKWAKKEDIVNHLKIEHIMPTLRRDDILTPDEINLMIETTPNIMYKALISLLFESGGRIHEVLPLKFEDIKETEKGMIIRIHATKTGDEYRSILCVFSAVYIRDLVSEKTLMKGDLLFNVKRSAVHQMLNIIAKKVGIEKPISPHKFRHAQAVDMLIRGYPDQITKKKLGWKGDSAMLARYSHIVDDDVIDATLEKAGVDAPKTKIINITQPKTEYVKPIDMAMQMQKLNSINEDLKEKMEKMEKMVNDLKDFLGDAPRKIGMKKVWMRS